MKRVKWFLLAMLLPLLLLVISCCGHVAPELIFHSLSGSCAAVEESTANISLEDGKVLFSGSVSTPTPCYDLEAEVELIDSSNTGYPQVIVVNITTHERQGECIQCIGEIPFSGEIGPFDTGEYDILILHEGSTIGEQMIEIE